MTKDYNDTVGELLANWLKTTADLHAHGVRLTDNAVEIMGTGDLKAFAEIVQQLDDVTDALLETTNSYGRSLDAIQATMGLPTMESLESVDETLPSLVKKTGLPN